jgi:ubiquinone/menaquinone biosynthesis C-methylase UbiE
MAGLLPDYSRQAQAYDETRAASPSVLEALRAALDGAPGPRLADIGGGTGNYALALAAEGWQPLVVDRSPEMLARASAKGLSTMQADAQQLPLADASFDAVMLISMLHHVEDRAAALSEARRILAPGGRLALMVFTREDIQDLWLIERFPSSRPWMEQTHPPLAELLALLPGAERREIVFEDLADASVAALASHPQRIIAEAQRPHTSYFERMARDHPEELAEGVRRLERELQQGTAPRRAGRASVLSLRPS